MQKINFQNLPSTTTPVNATNLNALQTNVENAIPTKISDLTNDSSFVEYKSVVSNVDLNDYKNYGIYYFYSNCSNAPTDYFYCLIMGAGGDCVQIGASVSYDNLYFRRYVNGTWSQWRTI